MAASSDDIKDKLKQRDYEEWAKVLFDEAHLPKVGLPTQWEKTQEKHCLIAFNPETKEKIEIDTNKLFKLKSDPVGFITSTRGKNPIPGTETPAAARYQRYGELNKHAVQDETGKLLVPCIAHGDYVQVESLHTDHMQAKEQILKRQMALVNKLNDKNEKAFAKFLLKQPGMDKFFVKHEDKIYGTLFFYELYFNDIDNVWLICGACNQHKSNDETLEWLNEQWLYGKEFLDYLGNIDPNSKILNKVKNKNGLAEVAIKWFWKRHANYISTKKNLLEKIVVPINILNKKVDHLMGTGQQKRAERWAAGLNIQVKLMESIASTSFRIRPESGESSSGSDSDSYLDTAVLTSPVKKDEINAAVSTAEKRFGGDSKKLFLSYLQEEKDRKKLTVSSQPKKD